MKDHPAFGDRAAALTRQEEVEEIAQGIYYWGFFAIIGLSSFAVLNWLGLGGFAPFAGVIYLMITYLYNERQEMKRFQQELKDLNVNV